MEVFFFLFFFFFSEVEQVLATMVGDERIIGKGGAVWLWKNWRCFFLEVEVL